ncbi:MAG: glycosyltransferase [Alphaproteobacteria bacterium]|nr:glycosyltransferase [Hyphomonas sp.]MBU3921389.1 glycosyltransferase [Alphaproteobacteria bacterium]MBU4063402.1 glycosyltransferase [Alphaproteobacteria bacterium]
MLVSVVLPCYNGAATLAAMLDSLVRQTYDGDWELVFVNNGSTDNSVEMALSYADRLPVRVVNAYVGHGPQGTVGHSYFVGFRAAKGDLILVCESDDICDPDWMKHMVKALETCDFAVPALEYETLNPPTVTWGKDRGLQARGEGLPSNVGPLHLPYAACNAIGMTRDCYRRVGDPTEWMRTAWDVDYCWRVQLAGMKLTFVPEALVHYRLRDTAAGRFKQARNYGRGHVNLHIRYGMRPWWRYLAFSLYRLVRAGIFNVFGTLFGKRPFAYWVYDWGFARGQLDAFPILLKAQLKHVQPERSVLEGKKPEGPQTSVTIPET